MGFPLASFGVAVREAVALRAVSVSSGEVTSTEATTCATVSVASPDTPSVVALIMEDPLVIMEDPLVTAVARPAEFTVATGRLLELQVKDFPEMMVPAASLALA